MKSARTTAWFLVLGVLACAGDPREAPVREAVERFVAALDQADGGGLWDLADRQTQKAFDDLMTEIREGLSLVDRWWPEQEKASARRAIGGDLVGQRADGRSLFLALLDPRKLNAPTDPDSRRIDRVVWTEDRATVVMRSGDTLEFRQEPDGTWRTSVFLEAWKGHPAVATLQRNLQVLRENARVLSEMAAELPPEAP